MTRPMRFRCPRGIWDRAGIQPAGYELAAIALHDGFAEKFIAGGLKPGEELLEGGSVNALRVRGCHGVQHETLNSFSL